MEVVTMYKVGKYLFKNKKLAEKVEDIIEAYPDIEFSIEKSTRNKESLRLWFNDFSLDGTSFIDIDTNDVTVNLISSNLELSKEYFDYLDRLGIEHSEYKSIHKFKCSKPLSLKEKFSILLDFSKKEYWGA
mgnify:CR=1 FL=1|jgi:hypothetical protein